MYILIHGGCLTSSSRPIRPYSVLGLELHLETDQEQAPTLLSTIAVHTASSRTKAERPAGRSAPSSFAVPFAACACSSCLNPSMSLAPRLKVLNQPQATRPSAQMAPWLRIIPSNLRIDLLRPYIITILTVAALADARSQTNSGSFTHPRGHDPVLSFEHLQSIFSSIFSHVSNFARQSGQTGFWDMFYFVMACGLIQSIRIWKNRRQTRQEGSMPSNSSVVGGRHGRENLRASLDDNGNLRKGECEYLV